MRVSVMMAAAGMLALVAGCGTEPHERTSGGAAAGAATGAGVGALGGPVGAAVGAVVGGGAGAATGATTKPSDVNLGKPPWTNPQTRVPSVGRATVSSSDNSSNDFNARSLAAAQRGQSYSP
jgi:phage tail tape-measure protein